MLYTVLNPGSDSLIKSVNFVRDLGSVDNTLYEKSNIFHN